VFAVGGPGSCRGPDSPSVAAVTYSSVPWATSMGLSYDQARAQAVAAARAPFVPHERVFVHGPADIVAAMVGQQAVPVFARGGTDAWPTSPSRDPGWAALMPRCRAASVALISSRSCGRGVPTVKLTAASAHQPPTKAPQSMLTRSPSASRVWSGIP
jgi:hypothetical protein